MDLRLHQAPNSTPHPDTSDWTGRAGGQSDRNVNREVFGSCWFWYRPPACRIYHSVFSFLHGQTVTRVLRPAVAVRAARSGGQKAL